MVSSPRSIQVDIDGCPVHVVDHGGDPDRPTIVCVHGLAGSHANWRGLAAGLAPHARVIAVDLPGHGRTPRLGRSSAVLANRRVLDRLLQDVIAKPVVLVGHSMGATLSILQAAAEPATVDAMAVIAPPMPRVPTELPSPLMAAQVALCAWPWLARRTLSNRLQRLGAEEFVRQALQRTCVSPDTVDPVTLAMLVELVDSRAAGDDAQAAFVEAARSMGILVARAATYRQAIQGVRCPTLLVHGQGDRLLRHGALKQLSALQPSWRIDVLDGVGHSPHMEAPRRTGKRILDHLRHMSTETTGNTGHVESTAAAHGVEHVLSS